MAGTGTGPRTQTTTPGRPRVLLLVGALLNLLPPGVYWLLVAFLVTPEQFSLVAGTGSLAAALCTLYALHRARPSWSIRLLLGGVALVATVLFIAGDALVRVMPTESIGPGLVPLVGMLLHLSAAVTLFTLWLVYRHPRTAAPRR